MNTAIKTRIYGQDYRNIVVETRMPPSRREIPPSRQEYVVKNTRITPSREGLLPLRQEYAVKNIQIASSREGLLSLGKGITLVEIVIPTLEVGINPLSSHRSPLPVTAEFHSKLQRTRTFWSRFTEFQT